MSATPVVPGAAAARHPGPTYRFLAGAGQAGTTPPAAGSPAGRAANAEFAPEFGSCAGAAYPTTGRFALQEPFQDLNGTGQWDAGFDLNGGPDGKASDPFCDANGNGRWDGIYSDNGFGPVTSVHDPVDVRAVAISDGRHVPVVYASVEQIGMFDVYTEEARSDLLHTYHVTADLVVSADHNESSPDSIGLYGPVQTPAGVSARSGIDEFFMRFVDDRIALAAARAVRALRPARLYANQIETRLADGQSGNQYPLLHGLSQRISDQFPTSVALPNDDRVAAVDPKLGVLQARDAHGRSIFTVVSLAAHNQEMGDSGPQISGDWPGALVRAYDAAHAGMAEFLVGDNGSEEDPETQPVVIPKGSENHSSPAEQFIQARATGRRFAVLAAQAAAAAVPLAPGPVMLRREAICVPLENNGFLALAAAGEFGRRQAWTCDSSGHPVQPVPNGSVAPTTGSQFRTFVSYADVGPDLQMIDNPGESFPALMLGTPFGVEDESCDRPNPPVPTWHARGLFRFQVGLADDLLGYLIPAWGFASGTPGLFSTDNCYQDRHGHGHKLESESIGPTGSNDVAGALTALLSAEPDPSAAVLRGRYVRADGTLSRWPIGAVALLLAGSGGTVLDPAHGRLIGAPGVAAVGRRRITEHGMFMDYDGQPQPGGDVTTRGMMILGRDGCVRSRVYVDVFPSLAGQDERLGALRRGPRAWPRHGCRRLVVRGVPELQPGAARAAGLPR